jgi:nitrile hydratase
MTDTRNERVALRVKTLEDILFRDGLVVDGELEAILDDFLAASKPLNGARLVARAWVDRAFAERLLHNGTAAAAEMNFEVAPKGQPEVQLKVVENTASVHNVIVCTLCSCYPLRLLGTPPTWYKSAEYRSRVVREPRGVLAEFGLHVSPDIELRVWDSTAHVRYMVLPQRPDGTADMNEDDLAALVRRDSLLGVARVLPTS